jgi:transcriptional regulator with XRE-family HTH domain
MAKPADDERPSRRHRAGRRYRAAARKLGLRVRSLRRARGWTLEALAERADLDLKHLQKIEAGSLNVTLVTIVRISTGLGVSLGQLFEETSL